MDIVTPTALSSEIFDDSKQAMLAAIVDSSDDAIISKNLNGIITSWNASAERIFEHKESEVIGKHISIIIPPDRLSEEALIIGRIRQGQRVEHYETIRMTKTGKMLNISLTVSPIKNAAGIVIGASKIARDITERVMIEKKLKEYADQLQKLNRHKDEFIGMAGHELKTPLTSVSAYLQLLDKADIEGDNKRFVSKALQNVSKLTTLVTDLLDVSKIEAGKLQMHIENFDLVELVAESVDNFRHITVSHAIEFETTKAPIYVNGDRTRIEQVMVNFLTNAVKYSPEAKDIEVQMKRTDSDVIVSVHDKGIGVAEDQLDKLFSRFYRADELPGTISGLGIGLYISKEIIQRHGGKIWVESELGRGSAFYFSLPIVSK
jgi:PAS domain S-box-containing protein